MEALVLLIGRGGVYFGNQTRLNQTRTFDSVGDLLGHVEEEKGKEGKPLTGGSQSVSERREKEREVRWAELLLG